MSEPIFVSPYVRRGIAKIFRCQKHDTVLFVMIIRVSRENGPEVRGLGFYRNVGRRAYDL